jgi:Cdc6-like AAA superfamily ATPase
MYEELTEGYEPERFLFRDEQINEVLTDINHFNDKNVAINHLITGVTGSGKSSIMRHLVSKFDNCKYYDCSNFNTSMRLLKCISELKNGSLNNFIEKIIKDIKEKKYILILDEIGKLKDVELLGDYLNTIYRKTNSPIYLITNKLNCLNKFKEDSLKTLCFFNITFHEYDHQQLVLIIKDRLNKILSNGSIIDIPDHTISHIAEICKQDHNSSTRMALLITKICLIKNKYDKLFVNSCFYRLKLMELSSFLNRNLTTTEKRFLQIIIELLSEKTSITPQDIQKKMPDLSASRISQITTSLSNLGIIQYVYKNRGRAGGSIREISFIDEKYKGEILQALHPELLSDLTL